jgi:hypothetical protein
MAQADLSGLLTVEAAARVAGVTTQAVHGWIGRGRLAGGGRRPIPAVGGAAGGRGGGGRDGHPAALDRGGGRRAEATAPHRGGVSPRRWPLVAADLARTSERQMGQIDDGSAVVSRGDARSRPSLRREDRPAFDLTRPSACAESQRA